MLTATVFLPLVGALVVAALLDGERARRFAVAVFIVDFLLAAIVFGGYDRAEGGLQWVERYAGWVPFLDIEYSLASTASARRWCCSQGFWGWPRCSARGASSTG